MLVPLLLLVFSTASPLLRGDLVATVATVAAVAQAQAEQPAASNPVVTEGGERPYELERRKARSRFRYLMLGYGLIWVSLGYYLFDLNRRVTRVGREIDELKGRVDATHGGRGR
jgi:CcmD family protein